MRLILHLSILLVGFIIALMPIKGNAQFEETIKLTGDREERAEFGTSVALNDEFAVVGASRESIAAGAAYVFMKSDSGWEFAQKITANDAAEMAEFGGGMKLGENFLAIASGRADIGTALRAGAIYIYDLAENNFEFNSKLIASDYSDGALLAVNPTSMDVFENTILAGAPGTDNWSGAVYIFEREGNNWSETHKITAPEEIPYINFGIGVSISGNYMVAGASGENNGAGTAYIYEKSDAGNWEFVQKIQASDAQSNTYFGNSISLSGNQMVIGAYAEGHLGTNLAAAYVFERNEEGNWIEIQKISGPDANEDTYFAWMVEMNENRMAITAPHVYGLETGKVFIYEKTDDGTWEEVQMIVPEEDIIEDFFGWSVAMNSDEIIIGAPRDHFDANGENDMMDAGSAFIFTDNNLGISEENFLISATVYPNPAKNLIHIESSERVQLVEVYSVTGQKIITEKDVSVDISALPKGNYFIKIKMSLGNTKTLKFIKN